MNTEIKRRELIQNIESSVAPGRKSFAIAILLQIILLLCILLKPLLYRVFLDSVIMEQKWKLLQWIFPGYFLLALIEMTGNIMAVKVKNKLYFSILLQLRKKIWNAFAAESESQILKSAGDKKLRLDEDAEKVCRIYYAQKIDYVLQLSIVLCSLLFMVLTEWHISCMAILCIPLTVGLNDYLGRKEQILTERNRKNSEKINDWIQRDMSAWKQKKLLQTEEADIRVFQDYLQQYADYFSHWINYWTLRCLVIPQLKNEFVMKLGVYLAGGYFISLGNLKIGGLLVFINYYTYFVSALQELSDRNTEIIEEYPSIKRVLELLEKEKIETKNKIVKQAWLITDSIEKIQVEDLSFAYASMMEKGQEAGCLHQQAQQDTNSNDILSHRSLKMERGNIFLLRGKSGSGKSTLLSILAKIYPYERGHILLNDSVELSEIRQEEWYQKISCQMQEMVLFPGTIRENLYYAKPGASEQEMKEVLQAVDAWEFVSKMEDGLDSRLSENASNLSGGQRQRILLARTLLKEADVYLLDEPTSALDRKRERRVMEALKKLAEQKLVFVITHQN